MNGLSDFAYCDKGVYGSPTRERARNRLRELAHHR